MPLAATTLLEMVPAARLVRHMHAEGAPLAGDTVDGEVAAVGSNQLAGDGQPQAHAPQLAAAGPIHPVERLKKVRQVLDGDAGTAVGDSDANPLALRTSAQAHPARRGGVLDGVVQQVEHHLGDGIGVHVGHQVRGDVGDQPQPCEREQQQGQEEVGAYLHFPPGQEAKVHSTTLSCAYSSPAALKAGIRSPVLES